MHACNFKDFGLGLVDLGKRAAREVLPMCGVVLGGLVLLTAILFSMSYLQFVAGSTSYELNFMFADNIFVTWCARATLIAFGAALLGLAFSTVCEHGQVLRKNTQAAGDAASQSSDAA